MAINPAKQNIEYYNNEGVTKSFIVTDADGDPVDLSEDTLVLTIKKKKSGTAVFTLTTASELSVSGANGNTVNITLDHDLEERSYFYDLYDSTLDETIMFGLFIVTGEVHD